MSYEDHAGKEVLEIHPDGHRAVISVRAKDKSYYHAFGPDGLSLGVYDISAEAASAASWAWDFLEEYPSIRRLTLMQLIMEKLKLQYPLESADVTLVPKG
jgi:hypothetical protein